MRTITTPDALTMTVFTEVVRQGSFTAASRRLGIAKSAASKRVAALESSMGVKLLRRTTRKVVPTREGLTVFHATSRVVDAIADARVALDRTAASVGGAIRVSAPVTFSQMYLAPALARFTRSSPGVTVDLVTDDRFVDVVTGGFDLVVRIGRLGDGGYTARKLARTGVVICASPEYLARAGTPETIADLARFNCLRYNLVEDEWRLRAGAHGATGNFLASDGTVIREAAVAGLGLALLPAFMVAPLLTSGALVQVLEGHPGVSLDIHAVYADGAKLARRTRRLLEHLIAELRDPPWETATTQPKKRRRQRGATGGGGSL